jgi:hypothetical protein
MALRISVCLLILTAALADGDPTAEEEAFLKVPGVIRPSQNADRVFVTSELPATMRAALRGYDCAAPDGTLPAELHGFTFDLNRDGKPEHFIATTCGGSGGPDYLILTQRGGEWIALGEFQGGIHVMPAPSGWPELVTTSRGGGGTWAKTHHVFRRGRYIEVLIEHYDRGVITQEKVSKQT